MNDPYTSEPVAIECAAEASSAIGAIAELIESMPALLALYRIKWGNLDADANAVYERAEAALANVSGGAAA